MRIITKITLVIILLVVPFLLPLNYLIHFSLDDAYFYLKIADNISSGFGSTFDKINPTNGYHPLWTLLLSVVFYFVKIFVNTSPELLYRLTFIFTIILSVFSIHYLKKLFDLIQLNTKIELKIIVFILISIPLIYLNLIGFETQLYILLLSVYLYLFFTDYYQQKNRFLIVRSIITGLLILSRIDLVVFLFPFLLFFEYSSYSKNLYPLKKTAFFGLIPILTYSLYLIYNYLIFGNIMTSSSSIEISKEGLVLGNSLEMFKWFPYRILLFSIVLTLFFLFIVFKRNKLKYHQKIFIGIFISGVFFITTHSMLNHGGVKEWYFALALFGISLLTATINLPNLVDKLFKTVLVFSVILFFGCFRVMYYEFDDEYSYAKALNEIVDPAEKIFIFDHSGIISFFSDRQIINGDGLVNSFEYKRFIQKYGIKEYLSSNKIAYYSSYSYQNYPIQDQIFTETLHKSGIGTFEITFDDYEILALMPKIRGGKFNRQIGKWYLLKIKHNY